jgi:hypothetical protein
MALDTDLDRYHRGTTVDRRRRAEADALASKYRAERAARKAEQFEKQKKSR